MSLIFAYTSWYENNFFYRHTRERFAFTKRNSNNGHSNVCVFFVYLSSVQRMPCRLPHIKQTFNFPISVPPQPGETDTVAAQKINSSFYFHVQFLSSVSVYRDLREHGEIRCGRRADECRRRYRSRFREIFSLAAKIFEVNRSPIRPFSPGFMLRRDSLFGHPATVRPAISIGLQKNKNGVNGRPCVTRFSANASAVKR